MKTNNFISLVNHLVKTNRRIAWQFIEMSISILFASFPLYFGKYSAELWFIPMAGISLFVLALVSAGSLSSWLKVHKENSNNSDYDGLKAVFITEFGKQNIAANGIIRTAA